VKKEYLLDRLLDRSISYSEAEKECQRLKAVISAKTALIKEVGFTSWDEAEATIPELVKPDVLEKFQIQKGKPLPKSFKVSGVFKLSQGRTL
jgi:hypothetical protein